MPGVRSMAAGALAEDRQLQDVIVGWQRQLLRAVRRLQQPQATGTTGTALEDARDFQRLQVVLRGADALEAEGAGDFRL